MKNLASILAQSQMGKMIEQQGKQDSQEQQVLSLLSARARRGINKIEVNTLLLSLIIYTQGSTALFNVRMREEEFKKAFLEVVGHPLEIFKVVHSPTQSIQVTSH